MTNLSRVFQECGIESLPVDLTRICMKLGVGISTYRDFALLQGITEEEVCRRFYQDGFTLAGKSRKVILYNQRQTNLMRRRFTIAHELAHILLGHLEGELNSAVDLGKANDRDADNLAAELLCPSVVLHMMGVNTPLEIEQVCQVSSRAAEVCYRSLLHKRMVGGFFTTPEERAVLVQFCSFISSHHCKSAQGPMALRSDRKRLLCE